MHGAACASHTFVCWPNNAGVPNLVLGGRTEEGQLVRVHSLPVGRLQELSRQVREALEWGTKCVVWGCGGGSDGPLPWDGSSCMQAVWCAGLWHME